MELLPHPMSIYSMNDNDSHSKLDIVSTDDLGVWITTKPDFNLQCDKASAKAMQSLGLKKKTFKRLTKGFFSNITQDLHMPSP